MTFVLALKHFTKAIVNRCLPSRKILLDSDILHKIESSLNHPLFFEFPVGATLNDDLSVVFLNGKRSWDLRARLSDLFRYFFNRYRQPFSGLINYDQLKGKKLFTLLFDRDDLKGLIFPVMDNYPLQESFLFVTTPSMKEQFKDKNAITWDELATVDMNKWRKEFDRCEPVWKKRLSEILTENLIPIYVVRFLMARLQVQTQRIMAASEFFDRAFPQIIITEYDRNASSSCLVIAAKNKGIPSITMIHGAAIAPPPRYGFVPVLADHVCCWGSRHKENFIEHGVNERKLNVTGCQAIKPCVESNKLATLSNIGFTGDAPVAMLATSPIFPAEKFEYTSKFCEAMSQLAMYRSIVRLHPAESLSEYKDLIEKYPNVTFIKNDSLSKDEALSVADIVVVHESSFGVDALLKGSVVIVFDALNHQSFTQLMIGKELIEKAGCPSPTSASDLADVIREVTSNSEIRNTLVANAKSYAESYCKFYEQDAANEVTRLIDHVLIKYDINGNNAIGKSEL